MWMFQEVEDGKSGRMQGQKSMHRYWEMVTCWQQWREMRDIRSYGFPPMISGKWKVAANWEFFHDNSVAKCDPAVGGGSPRPIGRMVFDIPEMEGAQWHTEQQFSTATTVTTLTDKKGKRCFMKSWAAAVENILVIEFETEKDLEIELLIFIFLMKLGKGCETAADIWDMENRITFRMGCLWDL